MVEALAIAHLEQRQWQAARFYLQRARGWASDVPQEQQRIRSLLQRVDNAIAAEQTPQSVSP